jgi:hypothetical protein
VTTTTTTTSSTTQELAPVLHNLKPPAPTPMDLSQPASASKPQSIIVQQPGKIPTQITHVRRLRCSSDRNSYQLRPLTPCPKRERWTFIRSF